MLKHCRSIFRTDWNFVIYRQMEQIQNVNKSCWTWKEFYMECIRCHIQTIFESSVVVDKILELLIEYVYQNGKKILIYRSMLSWTDMTYRKMRQVYETWFSLIVGSLSITTTVQLNPEYKYGKLSPQERKKRR